MSLRLGDLLEVCRRLNQAGVKYVLIGGFAILIHGYERTTRDIDFLVDVSETNIRKIKDALQDLLPEACTELTPADVKENVVVRMSGEQLVIDLMKEVGPLNFEKVSRDCFIETIDGVPIPVASLDSMIELKEGVRDRDKKDYLFLKGKKEFLEKAKKDKS